jgi:hypothetical protein
MNRRTYRLSARSLPFMLAVVFAMTALIPGAARAQVVPGAEAGIVATGFGRAAEPAASATLQLIIGPNEFGYMGMPGEIIIEEGGVSGPMASPEMGAMPTMPAMPAMPAPMPTLTAEQLDPIVQALTDAGVASDAITVTVPDSSAMVYGPGGPTSGEIRVEVTNPQQDQLSDLVAAAREAATGANLSLFYVGATYIAADCATLVQQAREAAVADAEARAEGLAQAIGASLGPLVQAIDAPYFGPEGGDACAAAGTGIIYGPYGPGTGAPYDPNAPAEAVAYMQVTLTYEFGSGMATPTS